jgi:outer membrane receptor for ferrienterochelin and colicin
MKKIFTVIVLLLFLSTNDILAQNGNCSSITLENSKDRYEIGDFDSVKRNLEQCVKNRSFDSSDELNKARELLALTAIVEDMLEEAQSYIGEIVKSNSKFVPSYRNIVFNLIFDQVKRENIGVTVSSVSKKAEDLNTAPATVKLINQEEIMDRGYVDLIDLLSDLPGFDISKTFAVTYANIYQMGYRQENTERTLFMVDGVEENDLWLNWAYISRQYPLSNIKAVEVLYGPSSTMYGPRAFVGAINVLTYSPKELPVDHLGKASDTKEKESHFYLYGNTQIGNLKTRSADITLGMRGKAAALQVTGRYYASDEHDLSGTEFYDYSPDDIDHLGYKQMNLKGNGTSLNEYMKKFNLPSTHPYYEVLKNDAGNIDSIYLTAEGINKARELDRTSYTGKVNGQPIGYSNQTVDYFIGAKITVENFLFGIRHWKRTEGFNFYQDIDVAGSKNGSVWSPENTTIYAQYDREINDKISISNLSNFALHRLGKESNRVNFIAFGDPRGNLHLAHLLNPTELISNLKSEKSTTNTYGTEVQEMQNYSMMKNGWRNRYYYYEAQQFRNEARFFYESQKVKISSGIDLRSTLTQGDYLIYMDYETGGENSKAYKDQQSQTSLAREKGIVENQTEGSNMFSIIDIGFFNQITVNLGEKFILSGGNRIDYNKIRRNSGYGIAFSPRISAIFNTKHTTLKLNYSKGLQNVSQWTKYSTGGGRLPNSNLETESIDFINLEYLGRIGNGNIGWEINGFGYLIKDAVASGVIGGVRKNYNAGEYRNLGLMSGLYYTSISKNWKLQVNHTFYNPEQIKSTLSDFTQPLPLRLGDIASHRVNFSITRKNQIGQLRNVINLRANYVTERPIGPNTTQRYNPGVDGKGTIPAYLLVNANIGFKIQKLPFLRLDISVENLLNKNVLDNMNSQYFHPGPREASGTFNMPGDIPGRSYADRNVPYVPQRPRFYMVKLSYMLFNNTQ